MLHNSPGVAWQEISVHSEKPAMESIRRFFIFGNSFVFSHCNKSPLYSRYKNHLKMFMMIGDPTHCKRMNYLVVSKQLDVIYLDVIIAELT